MTANKVLISENKVLFNTFSSELSKYLDALNEAIEMYPPLELGAVTREVAELLRSSLAATSIETQYWDNLNSQLDKQGLTNKILRDTVLRGSKEPIEQFKAALRKVHSISVTDRDIQKYIVFEESSFGLLRGYAENILEEHCREYLTDEEEIAFFETVKNLASAIADYRVELEKVNANFYIGRSLAQIDHILKMSPKGDWTADAATAVYFHRYAKKNMKTNARVM